MKKRSLLWSTLAAACLFAGFALGQTQPQQPQGYWYVSEFRVDFRLVDSLRKMLQAHTLPVNQEAHRSGDFLEERWLFHHTGGEYNVMRMRRFRTWEAINSDSSFLVAFRRQVPDSARRAAINAAFGGVFQGAPHRDGIYTELAR